MIRKHHHYWVNIDLSLKFLSSCLEWSSSYPFLEKAGFETWAIDVLGWGFSDLGSNYIHAISVDSYLLVICFSCFYPICSNCFSFCARKSSLLWCRFQAPSPLSGSLMVFPALATKSVKFSAAISVLWQLNQCSVFEILAMEILHKKTDDISWT